MKYNKEDMKREYRHGIYIGIAVTFFVVYLFFAYTT